MAGSTQRGSLLAEGDDGCIPLTLTVNEAYAARLQVCPGLYRSCSALLFVSRSCTRPSSVSSTTGTNSFLFSISAQQGEGSVAPYEGEEPGAGC